ncbi:hypothetical protein ERJ75_001507400 [Trypanosoma vivax]|nr:hypothetical protein ERJ75_001507400 [Trypanosoma vivax]
MRRVAAGHACPLQCRTPGRLKADAPDKDKKVHTIGRVRRFRDFDYQVWPDGSVVPDVSSGAGALVHPKEVGVRRWSFELGRLRAAIARSVWRWRRN